MLFRSPRQHAPVPLVVSGIEGDLVGAVFGLDAVEPCGNLGICLIPGDPLELPFAPLAGPPQRIQQPVRPVGEAKVELSSGQNQ